MFSRADSKWNGREVLDCWQVQVFANIQGLITSPIYLPIGVGVESCSKVETEQKHKKSLSQKSLRENLKDTGGNPCYRNGVDISCGTGGWTVLYQISLSWLSKYKTTSFAWVELNKRVKSVKLDHTWRFCIKLSRKITWWLSFWIWRFFACGWNMRRNSINICGQDLPLVIWKGDTFFPYRRKNCQQVLCAYIIPKSVLRPQLSAIELIHKYFDARKSQCWDFLCIVLCKGHPFTPW